MATLNWPGFGLVSISPTLDQPSQSNSSAWTGTRTVIANPWHGKWSFRVALATRQGDAAFQAARAFFTSLKGQINTFHLPAVEAPQNGNTGVTLSANAAQGATSIALIGVTTALVAGNMVTLAGQLLSLTSVGSLSGSAQTVNFQPALRAAASSGASVETAKPYALVYLADSKFTWDIGSWRRYGLTFDATEAVGETDGADPALDVWTGGTGGSGGSGAGTSFSFPQLASFTSRSLLAAVTSPSDKQVAYLTEAGREGEFVFSTADLSAKVTADTAQGIYVAPAADTTGAAGAWVRKFGGSVNAKWFGAPGVGTTVADPTPDATAFVAAIATLKAFALNSGGGAYKGSPKLFIPAGHYYLGTTTLDINHSLMIEGEGSGRAPSPAYGCTHLRWADGCDGIRTQFPSTSGETTVDAGHDGAGSVYLRNFSMEGGYSGTDASNEAIVARAITFLDDLLIRNWSGTGVKSWTGTVLGTGYSGNTSVSRYTGVKVEGCKVGFDTRGTDSNVITFLNCEAYQCRQAGFVDDNGAGSNTYIGCHATYNGAVGGVGIYTQVSYSGKLYAVVWGQETGAATNAPSGTTADNTWWYYYGVGGVDALHPAWTSGMSGLLAGGDYIMLSNYPTILISCYVEGGGGFSQLGVGTFALGGTNLGLSSAGGSCLVPENDGLALKRLHGAALLHLDGNDQGAANGFTSRDSANNVLGSFTLNNQGATLQAGVGSGYRFSTLTAGVATLCCQVMHYGIDLPTGEAYYINATKVVGARQTGWTAATGTQARGAFAAAAAGTVSAAYVQAEAQASRDRIAALEARLIALEADVRTHGLIN